MSPGPRTSEPNPYDDAEELHESLDELGFNV
jgi:hypothetical protein